VLACAPVQCMAVQCLPVRLCSAWLCSACLRASVIHGCAVHGCVCLRVLECAWHLPLNLGAGCALKCVRRVPGALSPAVSMHLHKHTLLGEEGVQHHVLLGCQIELPALKVYPCSQACRPFLKGLLWRMRQRIQSLPYLLLLTLSLLAAH